MKNKCIIVVELLFLVAATAIAQVKVKSEKPKYPHIKPELILDGRITLISNSEAKLGGIRAGIEIDRVNRLGVGFYSFSSGVQTNSLKEISSDIILANLELNYSSFYYERVFLFSKKYEWSSTIHLGSGNVSGTYLYANGSIGRYKEPIQLTEISTTLYRHLTYFISIGGGFGYRQTRNAPDELLHVYNAPIFIFKLRIQPFKAFRGIWNKDIRKRY